MTNTESPFPTAPMSERAKNAENIQINLARARRDLVSARENLRQALARMEDAVTEDQTMHHADSPRIALAGVSLVLGEVSRDEDRWRGYASARKDQR